MFRYLAVLLPLLLAGNATAEPDAAQLFEQRCGSCHDHPTGRTPAREYLTPRLPSEIVYALTRGAMRQQGSMLTRDQIGALAVFLTGKPMDGEADPDANRCKDDGGPVVPGSGDWTEWGGGPDNLRLQMKGGITAEELPRLRVKWAFALPGLSGQPIAAGGRLFVTSRLGLVYALDAKTGCTRWWFKADGTLRSAVAVGKAGDATAVFFGDDNGDVRALDARTGKLLWTTRADPYPSARILGAVTYWDGRVYVPLASDDEADALDPKYECCKFRGGVAALDAATGKMIWRGYTIQETPKPTRRNSAGTQMYGPSGGSTWSAPTIDSKRRLIYATSGNGYSAPASGGTDAVMAFDIDTGRRVWSTQAVPDDIWLYRCDGQVDVKKGPVGNCPSPMGYDFDFTSPPLLRMTADGKPVLVAGSKQGIVWAFDPDNGGKLLWRTQVGKGSGAEQIWGLAAERAVFAANPAPDGPGFPAGGLSALDLATGKTLWRTPAPTVPCAWGASGCEHRQPGAVVAIPGAVISGALDGHLRAYATADGRILWDIDTARTYDAVNGMRAYGGNIDGSAEIVANGTLFVNSGNATATSPHRGSAVLAITADGK